MRKKKICFVATHAYPLFNPEEKSAHGGSEVQLYTIAKQLKKIYDVSFIVGDFGQANQEVYDGIRVVRSFNPKSAGASVLHKGLQALKYFFILIRLNPDVCITSSANSTVGVVGFYCTLFRRKHIHRTANFYDTNGVWIKQNGFLGRVYKWGLEHAGEVVCQTYEQKKALKDVHGINGVLFRNVFDFDSVKVPKKKDYILWVGRANRIKGAEHFLDLADANPKEKFVMVFNNQHQDYFDDISRRAKKIKNVNFIEKVSFDKIQRYFDEAKVFASTSSAEGFANTFIQAGIGRTPIITLNCSPDNFIDKYGCGVFAKGSKKRLDEGLKRLLSEDRFYAKCSKNVFEYMKDKYDVKKNMKVIEKLI